MNTNYNPNLPVPFALRNRRQQSLHAGEIFLEPTIKGTTNFNHQIMQTMIDKRTNRNNNIFRKRKHMHCLK